MKKSRAIIAILLIISLITAFIPTISKAVALPDLDIAVDQNSVEIGDIVTLTVSTGADDLEAYTYNIHYDQTKFEFVAPASVPIGSVYNTATPGFFSDGYSLNGVPVGALSYTFRAIAGGKCDFVVDGEGLKGADNYDDFGPITKTVTVPYNDPTYAIEADYTGIVMANEAKAVNMSLVGTAATVYPKVRFEVEVVTKPTDGVVTLMATDSLSNTYDMVTYGWGDPDNGFMVGTTFTNTTPVTATFSKAGNYAIKVNLVDLTANKAVITSKTINVTVQDYVPYTIEATYFGAVKVNETKNVDMSLISTDGRNYSHVRFDIAIPTKPAGSTVTLIANDGSNDYDLAQIGIWGPPTGFAIGGAVNNTTPVAATFSAPGDYSIKIDLVDLDNGNAIIATKTLNVTVADYDAYDLKLYYTENDYKTKLNTETPLILELNAETEYGKPYEHVRVYYEVKGPDGATIKVFQYEYDAEGNIIDKLEITGQNYFEPADGEPLTGNSVYGAFGLMVDTAGDYIITLTAVDLDDNEAVIARGEFLLTYAEPIVDEELPDELPETGKATSSAFSVISLITLAGAVALKITKI